MGGGEVVIILRRGGGPGRNEGQGDTEENGMEIKGGGKAPPA